MGAVGAMAKRRKEECAPAMHLLCTCNAVGVEYPRIGWRAESEMAAVHTKEKGARAYLERLAEGLVKEPLDEDEEPDVKDEHLDVKKDVKDELDEEERGKWSPRNHQRSTYLY